MPQLLHSHWITNGHIHQKPLPTSTKPESADDHLQRDDRFQFPFKISARQLSSPSWSVMAIIYRFILAYYVFENLIQWTTFCLLPLFPLEFEAFYVFSLQSVWELKHEATVTRNTSDCCLPLRISLWFQPSQLQIVSERCFTQSNQTPENKLIFFLIFISWFFFHECTSNLT